MPPHEPLAPGVRGIATRAPKGMKIDGDLSEFKDAFATPVEYFNADVKNRPAQFFYMWDEEAFYAGLRTLDEPDKQADNADNDHLWDGDDVEWYFDTRRGPDFRDTHWGKGSVHCYWTGLTGKELKPRFCLRPRYLDAIPKVSVEVAACRTAHGLDVEFKLPWANLPNFKPTTGEVIAIDAELCYSDGGPRIFRSFVYGSPLSVDQPASLAKVQLVEKLTPEMWKACGPVMMPLHIDVPWAQPNTTAHAFASIALPPNQANQVGKVLFRTLDLNGKTLGDYPATREVIQEDGNFVRLNASWPIDSAAPGRHQVIAIVLDPAGRELTRIAPRLVSMNWVPGY